MKKKILCLVLVLLLLAGGLFCLPLQASAATVYFSSVNDTLLELSSSTMPAYIGGGLYVPYGMFNNSILGVYFSYDRSEQKASLLYGGKQLYFDLSTGETFDADGNSYAATAAYYNGRVYLPLAFICGFFGFSYSTINSEGLGIIVRVKDANVVMSDTMFEQAARSLMTERLNKYLGSSQPADPTPSPTEPEEEEEHTDIRVNLGFIGLSGAEDVLELLKDYGMHATFFVTGGEIQAQPELVRSILCAGHNLGIDLARETDPEQAQTLLFAAARRRTMLVSGGEAPAGYSLCRYDLAAADAGLSKLRNAAANARSSLAVCFDGEADTELLTSFLRYLWAGQFDVRPFNELSGGD